MKIALIGLGQIGSRYDVDLKTSFSHRNSILRNIRDSEKFYIDKDIAYVESIAKKDNARFSSNLDILPKEIDLAIISVPTKYHLNCFLKLISCRNIKKLILEKPVGINYPESKLINDKSRRNSLNIYINYMRNTLPETEKIFKYINSNKIKNFNIEISVSGTLLNNGSHFLALIKYITRLPLEKFEKDNSNTSIKLLKYKNNSILLKSNVDIKYPSFKLNIYHDKGLIEYDEIRNKWTIFSFEKNSKNAKFCKLKEEENYGLNLNFAQDYFLKYVLSNFKPYDKKIDVETAMLIQKLLS